MIPESPDSVIAQEQVEVDNDYVKLPTHCPPFKNIRNPGSDVSKSEILISAPKKLNACDISLLAAAGISQVSVKRRLKIGFFSTGDELVPLGEPLASGKIYDSNRYLLANLLADPNHVVCDMGIVADDRVELENILVNSASRFDVLISTGGASVGDADLITQTLQKCGQINFWKLAIKPGKPLAFGKVGPCWFFGLPGNPVAVLVTYNKFVKTALEKLVGAPSTRILQLQALSAESIKKSPGRQEYQRGILEQEDGGELRVRLAGPQDSHQLRVASRANCFIVLPADCDGIEAGQWVTVEPLSISFEG